MGQGPFIKPAASKAGGLKIPHTYALAQPESIRIDVVTDYEYYGYAPIGTATSAAHWRISRLTKANPQALLWADGNSDYDNIWDNRASLSYS